MMKNVGKKRRDKSILNLTVYIFKFLYPDSVGVENEYFRPKSYNNL